MSAFDNIPHFQTLGAKGQRVFVVEPLASWFNPDGYLYPFFEQMETMVLAPDEIVAGFVFPPSRREEGIARPLTFQYLRGHDERPSTVTQELEHQKVATLTHNRIEVRGRVGGKSGATELVLERWLDGNHTPMWVRRGQMAYQLFEAPTQYVPLDRRLLYSRLYQNVVRRWLKESVAVQGSALPTREQLLGALAGTFLEHFIPPNSPWERGQTDYRLIPYLRASAPVENEPILYRYWASGEAAHDPEALNITLAHLRGIYEQEQTALPVHGEVHS